MNAARQNKDGIGHAKVAPGMSPGSAHDDFKAAAAQSFSHDRVRTRAVQDQAISDRVFPAGMGKNVAHAAQIAFSLFAYVADE